MIVGNKIDLEEERTVAKQRGLDYAKDKKVAFYEVSAKDGTNIDLIFDTIGEGTFSFELRVLKGCESASGCSNRIN